MAAARIVKIRVTVSVVGVMIVANKNIYQNNCPRKRNQYLHGELGRDLLDGIAPDDRLILVQDSEEQNRKCIGDLPGDYVLQMYEGLPLGDTLDEEVKGP